jgi:hypothetical protein
VWGGQVSGHWLSANSPIQVLGGGAQEGPLRILASGSSFPIDRWQLTLSVPPQGTLSSSPISSLSVTERGCYTAPGGAEGI